MKIKEAVEIYNKQLGMKSFKEFIEELKGTTKDNCYTTNYYWIKLRFEDVLDDLKDLVDVAIKEYEEVLNGEYEKD